MSTHNISRAFNPDRTCPCPHCRRARIDARVSYPRPLDPAEVARAFERLRVVIAAKLGEMR